MLHYSINIMVMLTENTLKYNLNSNSVVDANHKSLM